MPPEVQEKAPEKASFDSGLLSNENLEATLNENQELINKGRSFMDQGEAVFSDEEAQAKENAAEGARATLIARMQDENAKSRNDAESMRNQHAEHKQRVMDAAITEAKERKKATFIAEAEYYAALSRTGPQNARQAMMDYTAFTHRLANADQDTINAVARCGQVINRNLHDGRGAFLRALTFSGTRRSHAHSAMNKAENNAYEASSKIPRIAGEWNRFLADYREKTYKVRSRNYDRLFQKYYMLSRGKQMNAAGEGQKFKRQGEEGFEEANRNNAKNITEYMGIYNNPDGIVAAINQNPFGNITSEIVVRKGLTEGSNNTLEGMMKRHTMVTMEAFGVDANNRQVRSLAEEQAGQQPVQRVRIKIDNQFKGYKARNQYNAEGTLAVDDAFAGRGDDAKRAMAELNLVVDEKGANGAYLFSQKSAKLYDLKNKRTGRRTNGFYIDGEFISADKDVVKNPNEISGSGKAGDQEKLRTAIRRSDFFRHINKGTIQYYMNYDEDEKRVQEKEIERKFMARRGQLFSLTSIGQNLYDGTILGTAGGMFGAYVGDQKNIPFVPDDAIDKVYGKYAATTGSMMNMDRAWGLGYKGLVAASVLPIAATIGQATGGAQISAILGNFINMANNIAVFVDLRKKWKSAKPGDQKWPLVMDFIDNTLSLISSITTVIDSFADALWSDQIKGFTNIIKNVFGMIRDTISVIGSGVEKSRITRSDRSLLTALDTFKNQRPEDNPDEFAKGEAVSKNAQSKMFLTLARRRATRDQVKGGFGFFAKGLDSVGTVMGLGEKSSWFNPVSLPFKLAGKVVSFIGMGVNKFIGMLQREDNMGIMLGDKSLDDISGFNQILKEETGINNRHYLADLVRVFTTIDTHCLLHKSAARNDNAGLKVAQDVIKPYYQKREGETIEAFVARVSFNRLMKAVGAPNNWRSVLLESIS